MAVVAVGADVLKVGRFEGLGPLQLQGLGGGVLLLLFGLSLFPLGQRPA
jgi:hypothetical protein